MKKKYAKDMLILIGASAVSMIAGMVVGCVKEKMKSNTCCLIDEM